MKLIPNVPFTLPIIVTRNSVVFPCTVQNLYIERQHSILSFNDARDNYESLCIVANQINVTLSEIRDEKDVATWGCLCRINSAESTTKGFKAFLEVLERVEISKFNFNQDPFTCEAKIVEDIEGDQHEEEVLIQAILKAIQDSGDIKTVLRRNDSDIINKLAKGASSKEISYLLSDSIDSDLGKKVSLLSASTINERLNEILTIIKSIDLSKSIEREINTKLQEATDKAQREYILREKQRIISKELGDDDDFDNRVMDELNKHPYPVDVKTKVEEELRRYHTMPQGTLESSLIKDYIDTVLSVPWYQQSKDNDSINDVKKVLDEDHYGLNKVKDRILEYLAVKQLNNNLKAPILCFFGPPGCGKTSLSRSIARALNRVFIKCSLGGINDEAEIRGHRRTYVGSKPGRIISLLRKAKVNNPVFLLDEVDKLGSNNFKGDPSSALLEVLDPEQNFSFTDNYLEVSYDLSNVLFICTANDISQIPAPLLDRLELVEVESYTVIDKIHIANDYLIDKALKANGLTKDEIEFSEEGLTYIIEHYTKESGVRDLDRKISTLIRKVIVKKLEGKLKDKVIIGKKEVTKLLGIEDYDSTNKEKGKQVGVVTGLAWTPYGGDILPIEVTYFKGKGGLIVTGQLGDVMKESCQIAYSYVKANAVKLGIDQGLFETNDLHIHVPEGAIKKDGPSAGCAITTAIASCLTGKPVSGDIAMTGEVTLRGNAMAIGGLKEKSLAAMRSGIKTILVPYENKKSVAELPKEVKDNVKIIYMKNVSEAIEYCLEK